jgi:hypothetical protein
MDGIKTQNMHFKLTYLADHVPFMEISHVLGRILLA